MPNLDHHYINMSIKDHTSNHNEPLVAARNLVLASSSSDRPRRPPLPSLSPHPPILSSSLRWTTPTITSQRFHMNFYIINSIPSPSISSQFPFHVLLPSVCCNPLFGWSARVIVSLNGFVATSSVQRCASCNPKVSICLVQNRWVGSPVLIPDHSFKHPAYLARGPICIAADRLDRHHLDDIIFLTCQYHQPTIQQPAVVQAAVVQSGSPQTAAVAVAAAAEAAAEATGRVEWWEGIVMTNRRNRSNKGGSSCGNDGDGCLGRSKTMIFGRSLDLVELVVWPAMTYTIPPSTTMQHPNPTTGTTTHAPMYGSSQRRENRSKRIKRQCATRARARDGRAGRRGRKVRWEAELSELPRTNGTIQSSMVDLVGGDTLVEIGSDGLVSIVRAEVTKHPAPPIKTNTAQRPNRGTNRPSGYSTPGACYQLTMDPTSTTNRQVAAPLPRNQTDADVDVRGRLPATCRSLQSSCGPMHWHINNTHRDLHFDVSHVEYGSVYHARSALTQRRGVDEAAMIAARRRTDDPIERPIRQLNRVYGGENYGMSGVGFGPSWGYLRGRTDGPVFLTRWSYDSPSSILRTSHDSPAILRRPSCESPAFLLRITFLLRTSSQLFESPFLGFPWSVSHRSCCQSTYFDETKRLVVRLSNSEMVTRITCTRRNLIIIAFLSNQ